MAQAADFFVSYTSTDRAWAEWIAWQLEAEGYQVVVQAWDFTPGRDWAHEMQHATANAERVVAVLSTAYLRSAHGEAEWRAFYAQDSSGERGLLLPVRVDIVDPPGLLKTRVYVDQVGKDAASARQALLAAARGVRGKPTDEPEFPGARQELRVSAIEVPLFPGRPAPGPFSFSVDTLAEGQQVGDEDLPMSIQGHYSGDPRPVRVVLQDSYANHYLQNPEVQFWPMIPGVLKTYFRVKALPSSISFWWTRRGRNSLMKWHKESNGGRLVHCLQAA
jgi:hypothetical protein